MTATAKRKPDFERQRQAIWYGAGNLSEEARAACAHHVPASWFKDSTRDRRGQTDAERLLTGIDHAIGFFDVRGGGLTAAGNAVVSDVQSITSAAQRLLLAIQMADEAARGAIDLHAAASIPPDPDQLQLTDTSLMAVHPFQALRHMGHLDVACVIREAGIYEDRSRSFLAALWDVASDVVNLGEQIVARTEKGPNIRPDRLNAEAMARSIVAHASAELGRCLPVSPWVADLIHQAASLRGVTIGKQVALREVRAYASRHKDRSRRLA
ncbi:hypothetical protein ACFOHU_06845 [Ottowia pentelensis]|uniref:Uncharacterized protein n=1 Tax=Ottowia pentelensis TaxID=511108 RepID=A0ABV6PUJ2_9BURK